MQRLLALTLFMAWAGALAAQLPKDAEERHQFKYGRSSPVAESQTRRESSPLPAKTPDPFRQLDTDGDGKISRDEWALREGAPDECGRTCCRKGGA